MWLFGEEEAIIIYRYFFAGPAQKVGLTFPFFVRDFAILNTFWAGPVKKHPVLQWEQRSVRMEEEDIICFD